MATHLLDNGADLRCIQQILDHEKLETTKTYTYLSIEGLKEVHARTHPADNPDLDIRKMNDTVLPVMAVVTDIVEELKLLPERELEAAARFVHQLRERRKNERLAALRELQGSLSGEQGEAFEKAIEEGCEQIDERSW